MCICFIISPPLAILGVCLIHLFLLVFSLRLGLLSLFVVHFVSIYLPAMVNGVSLHLLLLLYTLSLCNANQVQPLYASESKEALSSFHFFCPLST